MNADTLIRLTAAAVTFVALCTSARAQTEHPAVAFVQPSNTSVPCQVGRANVKTGETVTWQGQCANGLAQGPGIAQWLAGGKPTLRFEGTFARGVLEGKGKMIGADGDRYEGDYKGGLRHGHGVYTAANGARFEGEYVNNQRGAASAPSAATVTPPASPPPQVADAPKPAALPPPPKASAPAQPATPSPAATPRGARPGMVGLENTMPSGAVLRVEACGGWPIVAGKLPKSIDLSNSTRSGDYAESDPTGGVLVTVLKESGAVLQKSCELNPNHQPFVYLFTDQLPPTGTPLNQQDKKIPVYATRYAGDRWHVENRIFEARVQAEGAQREQQQRQAQLAAKAEADKKVADRDKASKERFAQFFKKHGLAEKEPKGIGANPFAFEGQKLLFLTHFEQMQSATTGLFLMNDEGPIIVTDIPKGTFVTTGKVLLAGKVVGNVKFEGVVGGLMAVNGMVPNVKFLGALICSTQRCEEMQEK